MTQVTKKFKERVHCEAWWCYSDWRCQKYVRWRSKEGSSERWQATMTMSKTSAWDQLDATITSWYENIHCKDGCNSNRFHFFGTLKFYCNKQNNTTKSQVQRKLPNNRRQSTKKPFHHCYLFWHTAHLRIEVEMFYSRHNCQLAIMEDPEFVSD